MTDAPGFSVAFREESVAAFRFPDGAYWRDVRREDRTRAPVTA
jgi:hypothetical protein